MPEMGTRSSLFWTTESSTSYRAQTVQCEDVKPNQTKRVTCIIFIDIQSTHFTIFLESCEFTPGCIRGGGSLTIPCGDDWRGLAKCGEHGWLYSVFGWYVIWWSNYQCSEWPGGWSSGTALAYTSMIFTCVTLPRLGTAEHPGFPEVHAERMTCVSSIKTEWNRSKWYQDGTLVAMIEKALRNEKLQALCKHLQP